MARMSIDDMFLRDTRVQKLARRMGWNKYEARGRLLEVFAVVYDRVDANKGDLLELHDIDIAADCDGLGVAMLELDLAVECSKRIRIRGAQERTRYLATRQTAGQAGGLKSGESRRNKPKVTFEANRSSPSPNCEAPANPSVPDPDPASASADPNLNPTHTQNARARESGFGSDPDPEARVADSLLAKLSSYNGVEYSCSPRHKQLIADRLSEGITVDELRMVIGYCAFELGWATRPEMLASLRPETLFGESISKYLDPARSWFRKLQEQESRVSA